MKDRVARVIVEAARKSALKRAGGWGCRLIFHQPKVPAKLLAKGDERKD